MNSKGNHIMEEILELFKSSLVVLVSIDSKLDNISNQLNDIQNDIHDIRGGRIIYHSITDIYDKLEEIQGVGMYTISDILDKLDYD